MNSTGTVLLLILLPTFLAFALVLGFLYLRYWSAVWGRPRPPPDKPPKKKQDDEKKRERRREKRRQQHHIATCPWCQQYLYQEEANNNNLMMPGACPCPCPCCAGGRLQDGGIEVEEQVLGEVEEGDLPRRTTAPYCYYQCCCAGCTCSCRCCCYCGYCRPVVAGGT